MGRKWRFPNATTQNAFGWNFEQCEELMLIAGYEEIKPYLSTVEQRWANTFEQHYFQAGNGVADSTIKNINLVRRRRNLPMLEFSETDIGDYARTPEKQPKADNRCRLRQEYIEADAAARTIMVNHARAEVQALPPPHHTLEELELQRQLREESEAAMTTSEVGNRATALRRSRAVAHTLDVGIATRMLVLTSDAELRAEIIAAMSATDALAAAEQSEDQALRDLLVRHALAAMRRTAA